MRMQDVVDIVGGLERAGVAVWVDGGWCVDALVGRQLREHGDLDLAVDRDDDAALRAWLAGRGFLPRQNPNDTPWNYVVADESGRSVDVHVFAFGANGDNVYGIEYPAAALTGHATIGGLAVRCIAPEWMFRFKTAYAPAPKDIADVNALADTFGYAIPPTHRRNDPPS